MKKINIISNILKVSVVVFIAFLAITSCHKDPVPGVDPTPDKLHEDPAKVVIEFVDCHLHADWNNIQDVGGPHQNPETQSKYLRRIQKISYELKKNVGWVLSEDSQKKLYAVKNGEYKIGKKFTPAPIYIVLIKYYNSKGELMNNQFVEKDQDKIHQHFFTPVDIEPTFDGELQEGDKVPTNLIEYLYTDTTPWDKTVKFDNAKITGKENPIGLKGVLRFKRDRVKFNLRIRLYHGHHSKLNPNSNEHDPFHTPSTVLVQSGTWDVDLKIPVIVCMERSVKRVCMV